MPRLDVDVAVVGAGVVGLASAAALSRAGRSVWVLERNEDIARETTSRNSEVIHAGIYYEPGSLKARLCVEGRRALVERCQALGIPHRLLGKVIVATRPEERETLERLHATATANGVEGLEHWDAAALRRREPAVRALSALHSPLSGVVDGHALCLSYLAEAESQGAVLLRQSELLALERCGDTWRVEVRRAGGERESLRCRAVVNAAGLEGTRVARMAGLDVEAQGYVLRFCKGDYFSLAPGRKLSLAGLVYPVPSGAGLGVHATLDLAGRIRFGPDAEYVEAPHYTVDPAKAEGFAAALRRYLPEVEADWLVPDYAGVRPKLSGPGEGFRDFVVSEESDAGAPGLVSCIGIESPGLTAAPAIAARVAELLVSL